MCGPILVRCRRLPAYLLATLAILAASATFPSPALGAEDKAAARDHYATGTRLYEVREYAKALKEYKAAYVAKADPAFLFNIGQCLRKMDRNEEALDFFQQYLKKAQPDDPNRAQVEARIRNITAGLASADDPFDQSDAAKSARPPAAEVEPPPIFQPPSPPEAVIPTPLPVPEVKSIPVSKPVALPEVVRPRTTQPSESAPQARAQPLAATPGAVQPPGLDLATSPRASEDHASTPVYGTWWFWTGIGAVVVAGTVTAIALSSGGGGTTIPSTTLGPRSVP